MWMCVYNMHNVHERPMIKHMYGNWIPISQQKIIKVWNHHAHYFHYDVMKDNFFYFAHIHIIYT